MKILFEEHKYKTEDVKNVLSSFMLTDLDLTRESQQLRYVGYFFNKNIENRDGTKGDLVFILPKVLMNEEEKAFGLAPEQLIDFNWRKWKDDNSLVVEDGRLSKKQVYDFIYGFSTWIYRAISIYRKNLQSKPKEEREEDEVEVMSSVNVGASGKKTDATFMDVLLSLIDFQRTHKDFITFVIKTTHSGFNKVSWPKTIARTQAVIQDGSPIYLNPINKQRVVNFDEELLIIYYSILNYMHEEYGFPIPNQPGYKLITGAQFRSYMKSQGKTRLHKIRYKYFSDDAVLLWNLCYAFFDKTDNTKAQANRHDYLLISSFHCVFEAMIDELVGDKNLPEGLKVHGDDKRIDHLYTYKYLLENMDERNEEGLPRDIYNIADSKYYKRNTQLKGHDVPKQFTYARNVIQWHMDLLHDLLQTDERNKAKAERYKVIPLFDDVTEGFNIIPNFFISAMVDEDLNYDAENLKQSTLKDEHIVFESFYFWERLFDRNSLFTLHYDVNFLFILKTYAQNKSYNKMAWKHKVRKEFRKKILEYLNNSFDFYQLMVPSNEVADFVDRHYRKLQGKVFSFEVVDNGRVLLYAERKEQNKHDDKAFKYDGKNDTHIETSGDTSWLKIPGRAGEVISKEVKNIILGTDNYILVREQEESHHATVTELIPAVPLIEEVKAPNANISAPVHKYMVEDHEVPLPVAAEDIIELFKSDVPSLKDEDDSLFPMLIGYTNRIDWVKEHCLYNMRSGEGPGSIDTFLDLVKASKTLMLYTDKKRTHSEVFACSYLRLVSKEEMEGLGYKKPKGDYHLCEVKPLENEYRISLAELDAAMNAKQRKEFWNYKMVVIKD